MNGLIAAKLEGVTLQYGDVLALDDVTLDIPGGCICLLYTSKVTLCRNVIKRDLRDTKHNVDIMQNQYQLFKVFPLFFRWQSQVDVYKRQHHRGGKERGKNP